MGQRINLPVSNVSPMRETTLSPETLACLKERRADDFALYDALMLSEGHLRG